MDPPPPPGQESGRIDADDGEDSAGRVAARGLLFVPKVMLDAVMYPASEAVGAEGNYDFSGWYNRWFTCCDNTVGLVPMAAWETGLGLTAGARVYDTDTFGGREHTTLQLTVGGTYRVHAYAAIDTGRRLGDLRLEASGNFDRLPRNPFYGIGNNSTLTDEDGVSGLDAFNDSTAVQSYFRSQEATGTLRADYQFTPELSMLGRAAYTQLKYTPSTNGPMIEDVYDPMTLVGFNTTTEHIYGELEARYDSRHGVSIYEPSTVHSVGSLVSINGGYAHQFNNMPAFWHYGTELQHYIRLGAGPRVLVARFHGEGVTGAVEDVPITELPMLGGGTFLRGYSYARFRDRLAAVGSLQYMWALMPYASAFVFSDVGRVYRGWDDLSLSGLHVGFGIGLDLYQKQSFLADLTLGSSSDGGITVTAEFSPVLDARPRWR